MKQLAQKLADGSMSVIDVAVPLIDSNSVLVQNYYSLISAGTEGGTVSAARKSLLGKALEKPQQVQQVIQTLQQQGPIQTYRAVSKKLDSYSALGYSSAGVVIDVGADVKRIAKGDLVACAGAGYANHAEVVSVPKNLCVRLDANAKLDLAAYNTLGSIALQGVRQADLRLGETCVVIGLGLLGHLVAKILRASGITIIGLDIDKIAIQAAKDHCIDIAQAVDSPGLVEDVLQVTGGIGADAVIITAATRSNHPINLAGRLLRQRGSVVVVGDVPTGFDREPDYYRKELQLKMSCSYGPGRYDPNYEEKGIDYPPGYVRWTENRNMQAFQNLLHSGTINIDYLTTHRFSLDSAPDAYELILNKTEPHLGIVIEYDISKSHLRDSLILGESRTRTKSSGQGVGFIGAGSYAMSHLLPNLPAGKDLSLRGVMTSSGTSSRSVAEKFGFNYVASSPQEVVADDQTGTVFIATRHDSHAEYVLAALHAGKNVFVEKPLCLSQDELEQIVIAWQQHKPILVVGFNRRFSALAKQAKAEIGGGPMSMLYRVNAGAIPPDSWIQDTEVGGGRIIGEVCHFVDFMIHANESLPNRVFASAMEDVFGTQDTVNINISFENGSTGSICYYANGPKSLAKEYIEIYKSGMAARIVDFKELEIFGGKKPIRRKLMSQDKGQKSMVREFLRAIDQGDPDLLPLNESLASTIATFGIMTSLRTGQSVDLIIPQQ